MATSTPLAGRIAVVTGAAGGIGRAIVMTLINQGARVYGIDRNAEAQSRMTDALAAVGGYTPYVADLADRTDTDRMLFALRADLANRCDILVNNAGISTLVPFAQTTDEQLDRMFAINVHAGFRITRALLPALLRSEHAAIVNTASELGFIGHAGYAAYCATKGAVLSWTRALAVELAPHVRVNAVCPGPVDTPMLQAEFTASGDAAAAHSYEIAHVPMGRLGTPGDIAGIVAFLASDAAAFVTGAAWTADGGKTVT
ncbi:MAG: SDR family oxidoreductase [Aquabacterium sp.]|nr:MAG: SDR family oxidoreductase [Aquabacterium sp.]